MKPSRAPRRGYVLLLVLLVVAIAATAMASVGRLSLEKSLQATRAQSDLRRRWAVITARAVLLPKAQAILEKSKQGGPVAQSELRLDGVTLSLVFGDEQAKANVNLLYAQGGLSGAEREVRSLVESTRAPIDVALRPFPDRGKLFGSAAAKDDDARAFETFAQVFAPRTPPRLLLGASSVSASPIAALTCWGDGSLNLRRAPDEAVRAVLSRRLAAGEITHLLELRAKSPDLDPSDLLDAIKLSDARREAVDDLLASESTCHSLWIVSATGERSWYDLAVSDGGGAQDVILFSW